MKKALGLLAASIIIMLASVLAYDPKVLAQVPGFFTTISVLSGGTLNGTFAGNASFTNIVGANISGNAATATNLNTSGTALQVWGMNSAGTAQGWQSPAGSLGGTGWTTYPDGHIEQWGMASADGNVTLPHTFASACWGVLVTTNNGGGASEYDSAGGNCVDNSTINISRSNSALTVFWTVRGQ